jgi:hypothetical protein
VSRPVYILLLFALVSLAGDTPTVGDKVIEFAVKHMKKKVDRGECWDLASAALNYAGADWTPPFNFGIKTDLSKTQRADILQFTDISIKFPNGSMSFPQHTAIVYKADKKTVTLIHQNFNNKRFVDTLTIHLDQIKSGKVEAFRPKKK